MADADFLDSVLTMYTLYLSAHKCLFLFAFIRDGGGKGVTHFLKLSDMGQETDCTVYMQAALGGMVHSVL